MKKRKWSRKRTVIILCWLACLGLIGVAAIMWFAHDRIDRAGDGRVYTSATDTPVRKVGLVLGCVQTLPNGRDNLYFRYRINAAADLFRADKVSRLLVSGDNTTKGSSESLDMREALIALGVPEDRIVCDFAGLRTLDSVVRAKEVFGETELIVISQDFHVRRAIYLGNHRGVDLIGYAAPDAISQGAFRNHFREALARVKAWMDVNLLHTPPRFLENPEPIGGDEKI